MIEKETRKEAKRVGTGGSLARGDIKEYIRAIKKYGTIIESQLGEDEKV